MDVIESHVIESHGAKIPVIGFGTMTLKDNLCVELVEAALHLGYRHLDTAQNYGNEREVGEGFRASGVPRENVFITTKVWFNRLAPGDLERSVDESLERLELPWVDLLLIHWPNAQIPIADSIGALCKRRRRKRPASHSRPCRSKPILISTRPRFWRRRTGTVWRWSAIVRWRAARCLPMRCSNTSAAPTINRRRKCRCASSSRKRSYRSLAHPSASGSRKISAASYSS